LRLALEVSNPVGCNITQGMKARFEFTPKDVLHQFTQETGVYKVSFLQATEF
jgi:hypothetical protein